MVAAEHFDHANVTAFPSTDEGYVRLIRMLATIADAAGTWRGSQAELAERLHVDVRTVGRWVKRAREAGYVTTSGKTEKLAYHLLAVPGPFEGRTPRPIRPEVMSEASDIPVSEASDIVSEAMSEASDIQIQPSRERDPFSSSSSSRFGHPASDTSDASASDRRGGGDEPPMTPVLTARGELQIIFHVSDPTEQTCEEWADLDAVGRDLVRRKVCAFPSTKDRDNPPPNWLESIVHTATSDAAARRLAASLPAASFASLIADVELAGERQPSVDEPRTVPQPHRVQLAPNRAIRGRSLWPWAVAAVTAVTAALMWSAGRGNR